MCIHKIKKRKTNVTTNTSQGISLVIHAMIVYLNDDVN